ncbi:MAG TPA: hypothetical protein VED83_01225 [Burkholderiaceae bacterium]|nr:hypothetical protein [Burkholderiaceae bacterium]
MSTVLWARLRPSVPLKSKSDRGGNARDCAAVATWRVLASVPRFFKARLAALACGAVLAGCESAPPAVHQQDLDTWVGAPVSALDTHPLFGTLPMVRVFPESGVEVRDYVNKRYVAGCLPPASAGSKTFTMNPGTYKAFRTCSENMSGCDNVFTIKNGKVMQFSPEGQCKTSEIVRPSGR